MARVTTVTGKIIVVGVLLFCGNALATDYYSAYSDIDNGETTHTQVSTNPALVSIASCAGEAGCCCTDNNSACDPVSGTQDCPDLETCGGCCSHGGSTQSDGMVHQTCCADGGACCQMGPACTKKTSKVCLTTGPDCSTGLVFLLCDSVASCPAAGAPLNRTLSVPDDLGFPDLDDLHNGDLEIRFEFTDASSLQSAINPLGPLSKEPPGIPMFSTLGLILLAAGLLVVGSGALLYRCLHGA